MMNDEDIKEYHNIGKESGLKKNNKYWTPLYKENEANWNKLENEKIK